MFFVIFSMGFVVFSLQTKLVDSNSLTVDLHFSSDRQVA